MAVVHDDDFDGQGVAGDGGELGDGHLETAIAADGEDELIGAGELGADGGRKSKAHGAEAAGIDPEAGFVEAAELGGPHLMLADVAGDDGVAGGEAVDFGHEVLGLDFGVAGGGVVGVLVLPGADLMPPGAAGGAARGIGFGGSFGEELGEFDEDAFDVADDGDVGSADLADFGGVDIDVDDFGVWGEGGEAAGDAVVEADAEGDEEVGIGQRHIGGVAAVHAGHGDEVGVIRRERAEAHQGSDDGSVGEGNELTEFGRGIGGDDAAAGINEGTRGFLDELGGAADLAGMSFGENLVTGKVDRSDGLVVALRLEDILGDVYEDGAGASGGGDVEGLVDDLREIVEFLDQIVVLGAGTSDAEGIGFLEGVAADQFAGDLSGNGDDGDGIHQGIDEAGGEVGGAGAGSGAADTDLAGGAGVAFGGEGGILLDR